MNGSQIDSLTIIGYQDWCYAEDNGLNHRDLHFATCLANMPEIKSVLFVSRPVSLAEQILRKKRWKSSAGELIDSGFGYRLYKLPGYRSLYVVSTWVPDLFSPLILGRRWWNRSFKKKRILKAISAAKRKLRMSDDALMLCTPFAVSVIDNVPHKVLAFDVIDNFAKHLQLREAERRFCAKAYERIDRAADVITCVSGEAAQVFSNEDAKLIVRNGVDDSWMSMAPRKPEELARLKGRIAGFGGTFTKKFNGGFLAQVARLLPEVDFVLMGKALDEDFLLPFRGLANLHYIGSRNFDELPAFYYHFDAGLILYHREKEHDGDPLKLYEYLSLGTPVVSLSARWALERFEGVLLLADTPELFAQAIRTALDSDRQAWRSKCRGAIRDEDFWENKSRLIWKRILSKAAAPGAELEPAVANREG
jgi:glycosyltransferase involved in cell wall biosynthesis